MAEASVSVDQDQFICSVCLDLLKDPVSLSCGHSFCKVCINGCWDQEDQKDVYSCPQCRDTFTPRPVLRRNNILAEVVEKLKKTEVQAASPDHCYAGPGDVKCDFCTERKHKAVKSCLMCVASFCETHLKTHLEIPVLKKHKLVEASGNLQEKICSEHDKILEIFCRSDQSFICYLCVMDKHRGHDTVPAAAERIEKQKKVQELKQAVSTIKLSTQTAVEDNEMIFTEMISFMEKKRSEEIKALVSGRQSAPYDRPDFQSDLCEDSSSITFNQHLSFQRVKKSLSDLKKRLEEICQEEFIKIPEHVEDVQILLSEPKSRQEFLKYFCDLTLDPNTVNHHLILSEKNRAVTYSEAMQRYSDHPERFDCYSQVLCKESVCGRCYWEVEWSSQRYVLISVSYKDISRKGRGIECWFGGNNQSWSLQCSPSSLFFYNNNIKTDLRVPSSSRIGVYVDHSAGTLSFYSVSDTMKLLHRVHTTFTQPLYAGFWLYWDVLCKSESTVRLCDRKKVMGL
ncbi:tripartite motif-containing protein 16-like, partial [Tachysurus ichikawai]